MTVITYAQIEDMAAQEALDILGGFHPVETDKTPDTCKTLLLLGPARGFWSHINSTPEMNDKRADPIDRWSTRVITKLAGKVGATAAFPFGGPPYAPFYSWALRTGRVWSSPVKLAVHDTHGLFVSFRGALLLPHALDLPDTPKEAPCSSCAKPCLGACPVWALTDEGYDVKTCHGYLDSDKGQACMTQGCAVRRSCPVGHTLRDPEQSAYHMSVFHKGPTV